MRYWIILLILCLPSTLHAMESASTVINHFQASLLSAMKQGDALDATGRYKQLTPAIEKSHDFALTAKISLGRNWKHLNKEQKALFVKTFTQLSISTYARHFHHYHGEHFQFVSEQARPRKKMLVRTWLIKKNGEKVHLDYLLHHSGKQWKIVNIIANGVSDLAMKRADYTAVIKKQGFHTLIIKLKVKISANNTTVRNKKRSRKRPSFL